MRSYRTSTCFCVSSIHQGPCLRVFWKALEFLFNLFIRHSLPGIKCPHLCHTQIVLLLKIVPHQKPWELLQELESKAEFGTVIAKKKHPLGKLVSRDLSIRQSHRFWKHVTRWPSLFKIDILFSYLPFLIGSCFGFLHAECFSDNKRRRKNKILSDKLQFRQEW